MHEIFDGRAAFRGIPAWHALGTVFPEDQVISVQDGFAMAGANYKIEKVEVPALSAFGTSILSNQYALVRGPIGENPAKFLNFVSGNYEVFGWEEAAVTLEPLVEKWPLETVGALGDGERFFLTLKVGTTVLNGSDRVDRYFLMNGNHGNGRGLNIVITTVRVVCNNTLEMALGSGSVVSLSHRIGVKGDAAVVSATIAKLQGADDLTVRTMERLALAKVTDDQVAQIINAAYPDPTEPAKARFAREALENGQTEASAHFKQSIDTFALYVKETEQNRQLAHEAYDRINAEFDDIARTAWAATNAVTEVANHREGRGNVGQSVVFGDRRVEGTRALAEAVRITNAILA